MSRTTFSGPIKAGTVRNNKYNNVGFTVLRQTELVTFNTTLKSENIIYLPSGSNILNVAVDVITAFDSATSATLTIGKTSAGTDYVSGVNAKTAARTIPTFTAAQLLAMQSTPVDISSSVTGEAPCSILYTTITSVGQPTAGSVYVTIQYTQADDRATYNTQ
jgi:hypothetical protein